ncbi:MAG: glutamine-hydrolyzing GMP synthase [Candidatus Eisenbacteria bacterium]|uniref:GMP synthase [glutamine-hydrolyzing] n=1 Tax=Eiseniibacteriota bacterium TaxID=2212470 RepID=A0A948RTL0_UNCEI|nr:glutamine-hydrolyzing GMP synthase [Candidatus Eisenbacteria bacterium]MBU1948229.1 glutamine-hydrolyzing GMP synthase [Candidatus Eisenbacteria bacterium]MBU2690306.1 glutamine-hydrolyzing GMP synthase [Candidatus Eisenbacteria bacterium]
MIIVLDFGSQYNLLIARRIRELGVYSEVHPYNLPASEIAARGATAVIFSGGPGSVTHIALQPDPAVMDLGLPLLGICYGMQVLAHLRKGRVEGSKIREYGKQILRIDRESPLFSGCTEPFQAWMSHGDSVTKRPDGFRVIASTAGLPVAAMEDRETRQFGVQFHPEVTHTPQGSRVLENFVRRIAGTKGDWSLGDFVKASVKRLGEQVGSGSAICGVSGGVDSTVAAVLSHQALGDRLYPVFVDHGLLRKNEAEEVFNFLTGMGLKVKKIEAAGRFFEKLRGITDPESKRRCIGETFIRVFEEEARRIPGLTHLIQGTLYPDVIESQSVKGPSATIKSHHNVGGLPEKMDLKLGEPLRELFKDEVRKVGHLLKIDPLILGRHPFPGPGLAVRILDEVTPEAVTALQEADAIFIEELRRGGVYDDVWQALAVLLPIRTVGVMGDERTYGQVVALRAVTSLDGMTADWVDLPRDVLERTATRIVNSIPSITRVVYDLTSKPPATIEWE